MLGQFQMLELRPKEYADIPVVVGIPNTPILFLLASCILTKFGDLGRLRGVNRGEAMQPILAYHECFHLRFCRNSIGL